MSDAPPKKELEPGELLAWFKSHTESEQRRLLIAFSQLTDTPPPVFITKPKYKL